MTGYFDSPWPGEDGGPARLAIPQHAAAFGLKPDEMLRSISRSKFFSTMTVLGAPGEVYLLSHSALRAKIGLATTAQVERVDPDTLETIERSPRLAGGPMWPGGMAVHRNGSLYVVYGRFAHRLDRNCRLTGSLELPVNQPHNGFVILDTGLLVTKNLSDRHHAILSVIDPDTMQQVHTPLEVPEPSVARLSSDGEVVYVVGTRSVFRYVWGEKAGLARDPTWVFNYAAGTQQTHGWDMVLDGANAWFMDNGHHRYRTNMFRAGVSQSANRLIRVSLQDAGDNEVIDVSGLPGGSITNPPVVDVGRRIVVGFDSANKVMRAWRFGGGHLEPLWEKSGIGCASHMVLFPDTGELVTNDFGTGGEHVVVLDIETGAERGRTCIGGLMQGVVFPSVGWNRDLYWCSMSKVARVFID